MILYPLLPETPYWLVLNGRPDEAEAVLHQMAKINGVLLPQVTLCFRVYISVTADDSTSGQMLATIHTMPGPPFVCVNNPFITLMLAQKALQGT